LFVAPLRITAEVSEHLCGALPWTEMRMTVRLTVVGFAALMLVPSLADAQGLTWHYEPNSLFGMLDMTFAQQHLALQYDPPSFPPEIMVLERRPVRRERAAPPITVVPLDPLPPEQHQQHQEQHRRRRCPWKATRSSNGAIWRRTQRCRCAATLVHPGCNDDTLRPDCAGGACLKKTRAGSTSSLSEIATAVRVRRCADAEARRRPRLAAYGIDASRRGTHTSG
jgi:hypothetical protein